MYPLPDLALTSAVPFGLFRSCRMLAAPAQAVVYPLVLPLQDCPLLPHLGARKIDGCRSPSSNTAMPWKV
ncbi:MAG: hypothetical protein HC918_08985 [Oscillatoriales cyanobacterium SM2_1_8]|nr:hypothetical protein [Oscillatoriales cyanobacterium SM2_1_8]